MEYIQDTREPQKCPARKGPNAPFGKKPYSEEA